jgi:hypothetical protein
MAVGASAWDGTADNQGGVYIYDTLLLTISGVVSDGAGLPCSRVVRIYNRATGDMIVSLQSDPVTGIYTVQIPVASEVQRVVLADDVAEGVLYNDIIDRVIPG